MCFGLNPAGTEPLATIASQSFTSYLPGSYYALNLLKKYGFIELNPIAGINSSSTVMSPETNDISWNWPSAALSRPALSYTATVRYGKTICKGIANRTPKKIPKAIHRYFL